MTCCHNYHVATEGNESVFSVDISSINFGHGVLKEAGEHAKSLGMSRVALFTDSKLRGLPYVAQARDALKAAGLDVAALTKGAWAQQRLMTNAPCDISQSDLGQLYRGAMRYW